MAPSESRGRTLPLPSGPSDVPDIAIDGGTLWYEEAGEGCPIVFIVGLGGLGAFWGAQRAAFAPGHRVVTFDHRGVGRSRGAPPYSLQQWARDLLALLDHLGLDRVHLVGHSTGGLIAQVFAAEHPERVRAVVLGGTWLRPDERFRALFRLRRDVLRALGADAYGRFGELLTRPVNRADSWSEPSSAAVDRNITCARIDVLLTQDGTAYAARIQADTLVLASDDDFLIPPYLSQDLTACVPHARYRSLSDGGHFFPRTRADAYNRIVADFLNRDAVPAGKAKEETIDE
jgi:aminoacrylate hydrolase